MTDTPVIDPLSKYQAYDMYGIPKSPSEIARLEEEKADQTNPKDLIGIKKPPIDLVPPVQAILTSLAFKDGAIKYGPYNWRQKKVRFTIYYAAILRHMAALFDGEDIDPISKVPHIAHASACIAIIMDALATGNLIDDRPTKGPSAQVIQEYTKE